MKKMIRKVLNLTGIEIHRKKKNNDIDVYEKIYGSESTKKRRFYNICAGGHYGFGGPFCHPCWTNVDCDRWVGKSDKYVPGRDIIHDLLSCSPLPIESATAELVYSQFTIEHITDEAAMLYFKEVRRILKEGGVFRVVCPNNVLDYIAYKRQDLSFFSWMKYFSRPDCYKGLMYKMPLNQASLEQIFLAHFASNASTIHSDGAEERIDDECVKKTISEMNFEDAMNFFVSKCSVEKQKKYRQNHVNWWNHDKVFRYLHKAGFETVYTMAPGQSAAPVMRNPNHFDRNWNNVALYIEAVKT